MGLVILVTNLEHEDGFHCKVSSKIACKIYTKLPINYIQIYIIYLVLTFLLI